MPTLFDPMRIGDLTLPNRVFLAPLTRTRATPDTRVPTPVMRDYYVQRVSAGLMLTEATSVSPTGVGYPRTPGLWSDAQVHGWTVITQAVHAAGGRIFAQLWHVGRISDPMYLDGALPVAPSALTYDGTIALVRPKRSYVTPRALEIHEIPGIIESYRLAAQNAQRAGFDGVEIHGANGYLLDQFLQDVSNHRTDEWGGSLENRARLMLSVADACVSVWGADRVGMHLAPRCDGFGMGDSHPEETFSYVARELGRRRLAFLCAREHQGEDQLGPKLKKIFGGPYVVNEGYTPESAAADLAAGNADAVAFGKLFIANADLPRRIRRGGPYEAPDPVTFYGDGPVGYTDYPTLGADGG